MPDVNQAPRSKARVLFSSHQLAVESDPMASGLRHWSARLGIVLLFVALPAPPACAAQVLVAVAANFADVIEKLRPSFERTSGHTLKVTSGSSGQLYALIKRGAPFHVLLSADAATPARLLMERAAVQGTGFTYCLGRLALWSRAPGFIGVDGLATLKAGQFRHLALAQPELAPFGAAAREVLHATGLWDAVRPKLVYGQNVAQVFSMVASGNAELGFVALTSLRAARPAAAGSTWEVPVNLYAPIRQDAVLLAGGEGNAGAVAFLDALKAPALRRQLESFGCGFD